MNLKLTNEQKKILIFLSFISVTLLFFLTDGPQWLNLESVKQNRSELLNYADQHYWFLFFTCGLLYIAVTAFSIPAGTVLSLALGFLFGRWMGTFLIVISATIGATLVFWLARYLFAELARERLQENEQAAKILNGFNDDAMSYMLFLRLVPLFPFWLVNLAPAFTPISSRTYILATALGIIPGSFVFSNLGQSLGQINNIEELWSIPVIIAFTLLGLLALSPVLVKRYKEYQVSRGQ